MLIGTSVKCETRWAFGLNSTRDSVKAKCGPVVARPFRELGDRPRFGSLSKSDGSPQPARPPVCLSEPALVTRSAWLSLVPLGMLMVDLARPDVLVELGADTGVSYCAFCQAVQELGLSTRCYAVDTWNGDPQSGFYGQDVFESLQSYHDPLYGQFSTLLRSTFDAVLPSFAPGSVDLLHIDGLHTYEAVRHDFESWLPSSSSEASCCSMTSPSRKTALACGSSGTRSRPTIRISKFGSVLVSVCLPWGRR